jgi:multiple sugar transport system substrate-binding protein
VKKFQVLLSVVMFFSVLLASCSTPATPAATSVPAPQKTAVLQNEGAGPTTAPAQTSGEKITISVTIYGTEGDPANKAFAQVASDYSAANPNVTFKFEYLPSLDLPSKIETMFLAGNEPDMIVYNYMGPSLDWIKSGLAVPMGDQLKQWGLTDRFKENALQTWTEPDGRLAGIPLPGFDWPVWYNMDILKKAGVDKIPTTQAELIDVAKKVRAAGFQPFSIGGKMGALTQLYQTAINQAFNPEDQAKHYRTGDYTSSDSAKKVTQSFIDLWKAGVFCDGCEGMDWGAMESNYFDGKAAMGFDGMWAYNAAPKEIQQVTVLGGFPVLDGAIADKPSAIMGAYVNQGIWVTRNGAKKMDDLGKFIVFFHTPAEYQTYVDTQAALSPLKDVTVQQNKTSPLYAQSLALADKVWSVRAGETLIPAAAWNEWDKIAVAAMDSQNTGDSVIKMLDDMYVNALK